ncbi:hypothetical protein RclHR1_21900001 [Rhizophagus clarus]|uniref:Uncharacterized protein n=1 Tax=Rhizophagus clarus TaxID=94130 RepID=A0A2Z6R6U1_9GLOM|nr:hypothetical protein RclHR1_21900001 [Rhizophagus clarus]GES95349.1 hypothetical protein GLOIN_2v1782042 [Rhizophagus clarus]
MFTKSLLNRFLDRVIYSNIYKLGNAQLLATQTKNLKITGKDLIKKNVENEVNRLQLYDQYLIIKATDYIWDSHSTPSQKESFENLANNVNVIININQNRNSSINNSDTIDRITRITIPQIINDHNSFENYFFNGTKDFHENGGLGL